MLEKRGATSSVKAIETSVDAVWPARPATAADMAPLRQAIAEMWKLIEDGLRH